MLVAPALAWGTTETKLKGVDSHGAACAVTIHDSGSRMSIDLEFSDYRFYDVTMERTSGNGTQFADTTMDYGNGTYARVIGAAITISKVGLIEVEGHTDLNTAGQITIAEMRGTGGLFSWWSRRFSCKDLR